MSEPHFNPPENCGSLDGNPNQYLQAIIRQKDGKNTRFFYDSNVLDQLEASPLQASFLILHEWLWSFVEPGRGESLRLLNRFLHGKDWEKLSSEADLFKVLENLGASPSLLAPYKSGGPIPNGSHLPSLVGDQTNLCYLSLQQILTCWGARFDTPLIKENVTHVVFISAYQGVFCYLQNQKVFCPMKDGTNNPYVTKQFTNPYVGLEQGTNTLCAKTASGIWDCAVENVADGSFRVFLQRQFDSHATQRMLYNSMVCELVKGTIRCKNFLHTHIPPVEGPRGVTQIGWDFYGLKNMFFYSKGGVLFKLDFTNPSQLAHQESHIPFTSEPGLEPFPHLGDAKCFGTKDYIRCQSPSYQIQTDGHQEKAMSFPRGEKTICLYSGEGIRCLAGEDAQTPSLLKMPAELKRPL